MNIEYWTNEEGTAGVAIVITDQFAIVYLYIRGEQVGTELSHQPDTLPVLRDELANRGLYPIKHMHVAV